MRLRSDTAVSTGLFMILFGLLSSVTFFWEPKTFRIVPSGSYIALPGALLLLYGLAEVKFKLREVTADVRVIAWGFVFVFITDWISRPYSYFQGPSIRGEILVASVLGYLIVARRRLWIFELLLPLAVLAAGITFFLEADGRILFSDDHATFFYRLALLKEKFPAIPFYGPLWNGGIDARDFFATGALNFFAIGSPLIYLFDLEAIYNLLVISILFVLLPTVIYYSAKLIDIKKPGPAIAALLSICSSLHWYKWGLKYGTMGYVNSTIWLPLNVVLISILLSKGRNLTRFQAALLVCTSTLMLFWSMSGIALLPLVVGALILLPRLVTKRHFFKIAGALIAINIPWILLFWNASKVSSFLSSEAKKEIVESAENTDNSIEVSERKGKVYKHSVEGISIQGSLSSVRTIAQSANPILIFVAVFGLFLLPSPFKIPFIAVSVWLALLGSVFVPLKPQLELDRMLVTLTILLTIPGGAVIQQILNRAHAIPAALFGGFLITGPLIAMTMLKNRSIEHYYFADESVNDLRSFIGSRERPGRILFSGCVIHELSHGHLAPLTHHTNKPLIASSQVHNLWWYKDVFPSPFLAKGHDGKKEYMDLYNVTGVFAHHHKEKKFFNRHKEDYKLVWQSGVWNFYERVQYTSSYFQSGIGKVMEQATDKIVVKLASESAVLKFNYLPFLESTACDVSGVEAGPDIEFIKLSNCPIGEPITIHAGSPFKRIF